MLFYYTVFNEDYISIYTLWSVPLPFLYCVLAGWVVWKLSLPPLSSDHGFAPSCVAPLELHVLLLWGCETARVSSHMIIAQ
jgi:hypothetical protein